MAFSTNIGAGGPPDGGMFVPSGTSVRQICLDLRDMLVGDPESRWKEVTGSSPTPSHLQTFASTINSSNVGDNNYGFGEHVTLYLADDNSLSFSNPGARLIRFNVLKRAIHFSALDTTNVVNNRVNIEDWVFASSVQRKSSFDNYPSQNKPFWLNDSNNSGYYRTTDPTGQDYKFYYVLDDEFLWVNAYAPEKSSGYVYRGGCFYHPTPPSNGTVSRRDVPHIFLLDGLAVHNTESGAYVPSSQKSGVINLANTNYFTAPGATDTQDRNIYSQCWVYNGYYSPNFYFDSFIPHIRVVDKDVYPNIDDDYEWPTVSLTGTDYFIAGGHDSDPLYAVRFN